MYTYNIAASFQKNTKEYYRNIRHSAFVVYLFEVMRMRTKYVASDVLSVLLVSGEKDGCGGPAST